MFRIYFIGVAGKKFNHLLIKAASGHSQCSVTPRVNTHFHVLFFSSQLSSQFPQPNSLSGSIFKGLNIVGKISYYFLTHRISQALFSARNPVMIHLMLPWLWLEREKLNLQTMASHHSLPRLFTFSTFEGSPISEKNLNIAKKFMEPGGASCANQGTCSACAQGEELCHVLMRGCTHAYT